MEFTAHQSEQEMSPAEPHFDEEATLLSARPVVPLDEIVAKERSGKRLAFGLAIAFSLIVGALGGALIYKQGHKESTAIFETVIAGADGIAVNEEVAAPSVNEPLAETSTGTLPERRAVPAETQPNTPSRRVRSSRSETAERNLPSQVDDNELRWKERIEEWRRRRKFERQAQKEARRHGNSSDDVLRIREIFEGSRRP